MILLYIILLISYSKRISTLLSESFIPVRFFFAKYYKWWNNWMPQPPAVHVSRALAWRWNLIYLWYPAGFIHAAFRKSDGLLLWFDSSWLLRDHDRAPGKYIKMWINVLRFSPQRTQKTQSMSTFYDIYLRRHVFLNLRSSVFICGFGLPGLFFSLNPRRAMNPGKLAVRENQNRNNRISHPLAAHVSRAPAWRWGLIK